MRHPATSSQRPSQSSSTRSHVSGGGTHVPHVDEAVQVAVPVVPHESEQGCVAFGAQSPAHVPAEHVYGHADPAFCQLPVASHVWGCVPLH